jgi:glycerol-3-phosphate acyltransferase PlsY
VLGSLMSVAGHTLSIFLRFRGGKGVATSLGVIVGLDPVTAGVAFGIWLIVVAVTRYISLASIIATVTVPILFWWLRKPVAYQVFVIVAAVAIVIKHRSNIVRLITRTETRIGEKVDINTGEGK